MIFTDKIRKKDGTTVRPEYLGSLDVLNTHIYLLNPEDNRDPFKLDKSDKGFVSWLYGFYFSKEENQSTDYALPRTIGKLILVPPYNIQNFKNLIGEKRRFVIIGNRTTKRLDEEVLLYDGIIQAGKYLEWEMSAGDPNFKVALPFVELFRKLI
jgi:hypothetical protein